MVWGGGGRHIFLNAREQPRERNRRSPAHTPPVDAPSSSSSASDDTSGPHLHRTASAVSSVGADADWPPPGVQFKSRGGSKKKNKTARTDVYALLGIEHLRWMATDKQIRDAYKVTALAAHPDKVAEDEREAAEAKFKQVQAAYETLSDPAKRREFDSTDAFDDSLPVDCAADDFYTVFGAAFRRNARWSSVTPVPDFGDADAPWPAVDAFYEFWYSFKSWREFPHEDEEDLECAESRDEKRWLERHNARLREAGKKEERKRLREFVEAAYERDPRVAARKAQVKAERAARAAERSKGRREQEEAEALARAAAEVAAAAAAQAHAEAAAAAKKVRDREKKAAQKARARVRAAAGDLDVDDVLTLDAAALDALADGLAAGGDTATAALASARSQVETGRESERAARDAARVRAEKAAAAAAADAARARCDAWSEEEVRLLQRALTKIPTGTPKRWDAVAALVRTRTVEEVLDMVKHGLAAGMYAPKPQGFEIAAKRRAAVAAAGGKDATTRDEAFTDVAIGRATSPAAKPPLPSANGGGGDGWTADEELALVRALKTHKGKEGLAKWSAVAGEVGKAAILCIAKFKALKETARAKK